MIIISDRAIERIKQIIAEQNYSIRVGVRGGGCSGFSYTFDVEKNPPTKFDHIIEKDGVVVIVDKKSAIFMSGTELDYESTLMKSGFVFKNPKAKSTCGCGSSFTA